MKAIDIPTRFPIPFGEDAGPSFRRTIPVDSQIGIDDGAASLETGFPPDTFVPIVAGGIPPDGRDFNGILYEISAWSRWCSAGGPLPWNAAWSAAAGGYPRGSIVAATTLGFYWLCDTDDNLTDPDSGGAGWLSFSNVPSSRVVTSSADFTIAITDTFVGMRRTVAPAATNISLPTATRVGQAYTIEDLVGNFSLYNVRLTPLIGTICGQSFWDLNEDFESGTVRRYDGNIWSINR